MIKQFFLMSVWRLLIQLQENNLYLQKIKNWFWLQMVKFTTTENYVNNLKENITFRLKVTAKLFWLFTKKKDLILLMK